MLSLFPLALLPLSLALPTINPYYPLQPRQNTTTNPLSQTQAQNAPIPVSRAGTVLNPSAATEANPPDLSATLAFSSTAIKTSDGKCLNINPLAGDFRQNLIPVTVQECTGGEGEKWDVISKGIHLESDGAVLVVSSLTHGCLNFDTRRAAGDQVILFSCGGRADGGGESTDSQEFAFTAGSKSLQLNPLSDAGTCLVPDGGKLSSAGCVKGDAAQVFSIGG